MSNRRNRIKALERSFAPTPGDQAFELISMALKRLSDEDLYLLIYALKSETPEKEWSERELASLKAYASSFGEEAKVWGTSTAATPDQTVVPPLG